MNPSITLLICNHLKRYATVFHTSQSQRRQGKPLWILDLDSVQQAVGSVSAARLMGDSMPDLLVPWRVSFIQLVLVDDLRLVLVHLLFEGMLLIRDDMQPLHAGFAKVVLREHP